MEDDGRRELRYSRDDRLARRRDRPTETVGVRRGRTILLLDLLLITLLIIGHRLVIVPRARRVAGYEMEITVESHLPDEVELTVSAEALSDTPPGAGKLVEITVVGDDETITIASIVDLLPPPGTPTRGYPLEFDPRGVDTAAWCIIAVNDESIRLRVPSEGPRR